MAQRDTCDPGLVRDADMLRDSCWRRAWSVGVIARSASRACELRAAGRSSRHNNGVPQMRHDRAADKTAVAGVVDARCDWMEARGLPSWPRSGDHRRTPRARLNVLLKWEASLNPIEAGSLGRGALCLTEPAGQCCAQGAGVERPGAGPGDEAVRSDEQRLGRGSAVRVATA